MKQFIAFCGLDCEACDARLATVNNDQALKQKVASLWSELNGVDITPEMINCDALKCKYEGGKKEKFFDFSLKSKNQLGKSSFLDTQPVFCCIVLSEILLFRLINQHFWFTDTYDKPKRVV